jgi:hypothetical protein
LGYEDGSWNDFLLVHAIRTKVPYGYMVLNIAGKCPGVKNMFFIRAIPWIDRNPRTVQKMQERVKN